MRLIFALAPGAALLFSGIALSGLDEKRARLFLRSLDRAFTAAGYLTAQERAAALGYDASQYSRMLALDKHPSCYAVLGVRNTTFLIALLSDLLFEFVKFTAMQLASDIAEDFRRRA